MKRYFSALILLVSIAAACVNIGAFLCGCGGQVEKGEPARQLTPAETARGSAEALATAYEAAYQAYAALHAQATPERRVWLEAKAAPVLDKAKPAVVLYGRLAAALTRIDGWRAAKASALAQGKPVPPLGSYLAADQVAAITALAIKILGTAEPLTAGDEAALVAWIEATSGPLYDLALRLIGEAVGAVRAPEPQPAKPLPATAAVALLEAP